MVRGRTERVLLHRDDGGRLEPRPDELPARAAAIEALFDRTGAVPVYSQVGDQRPGQ